MSKDENLSIYGIRIDPRVLERVKIERCLLKECHAACCAGGVWLNPDEKPRILQWVDEIKSYLPDSRHDVSTWFEEGDEDESYPEGIEQGTNVVDDPLRPGQTCCVFLRPDRVCALQAVSNEHHLGWPGLKPFYCALYPLYFEDDTFSIDDETPYDLEGATCNRPAMEEKPLFQIYKEESILVLGEEGYRELCRKVESGAVKVGSTES